jgi:hypothetical protein
VRGYLGQEGLPVWAQIVLPLASLLVGSALTWLVTSATRKQDRRERERDQKRRGLDETRRLLVMTLAASPRDLSPELSASISNALAGQLGLMSLDDAMRMCEGLLVTGSPWAREKGGSPHRRDRRAAPGAVVLGACDSSARRRSVKPARVTGWSRGGDSNP